MMAWWNFVGDIFRGGREVAEVFTENREHKGQRQHEEVMADIDRDLGSLAQYAAEFHQRQNRTRWDSFVDGLNRLPRPLLTIALLSFFLLAPLKPATFLQMAKAYELMPPGYWALLSVIVGFYFGGRMQIKAQDMTIRKDAVAAAKQLVSMQKTFRRLQSEDESAASRIYDRAVQSGLEPRHNKVVAQWLSGRSAS